ncbi:MAG: dolichyl-phosphate-mannose--protein mannosyltransferase, partial [Egibacteraceae bacterium]
PYTPSPMAIDTSAPPEAASAPDRASARPRPGGTADWLLPLLLLVVAGTLRFYNLGYPERIYFDETYYATQAQEYLTRGVEKDFAVHPPLGKWLIATGVAATTYDAFGWRLASAVAGTLLVGMTYLLGLRLFRRRGVAALAAFLLAVDGLALTMSRIAMLDIFLALFVALGVWLLLLDRDATWAGRAELDPDRPLPRRPHRWRWLAGVAFGLALATKWSAVLAIAGAGLFVLASEMVWRRQLTGSAWTNWFRIYASGLLTLLVVPLVTYVASYAGWFAHFPDTRPGREQCAEQPCDATAPQVVSAWFSEQRDIAEFHTDLEAEHTYRSNPFGWLVLYRPVAYYYESCTDDKLAKGTCVTEQGNVEEILGLGNPAVWWAALLAYPFLGWLAVTRRDWTALVPLGFLLVQYLPWLLAPRPNFLFYLMPATPFVCLALAQAAWRGSRHPFLRWLPAALAILAVSAFVFWYPVWSGIELPTEVWRRRMWFPSWV